MWDLDLGKAVRVIDAGPINSYAVAIHPGDGGTVAAGSNTGEVNVFETGGATDDPVVTLNPESKFTSCVAFSPDGNQVACGSMDGQLTLFDLNTGKDSSVVFKKPDAHAMPVRAVAFSPDLRAQMLFTASDDGTIKIFDSKAGTHIGTMSGHASWVLTLACNPNGTQIATGSSDRTVRVWDLKTRRCIHTFAEHTDQVWSVAYNRTGSRLASVGDDGMLHIYEIPPY